MTALFRRLATDEAGLILSAELVIILTVAVLGMVVGLVSVQHAVLSEFADLGLAFQSLNQSYGTPSYRGCWKWWGGRTSWYSGSSFIDLYDGCAATVSGYSGDIVGAYGTTGYGYGGGHNGSAYGLGTSNYSEVIVDPNSGTATHGGSTGVVTPNSGAPAAMPAPQSGPEFCPPAQSTPAPLSNPCPTCK